MNYKMERRVVQRGPGGPENQEKRFTRRRPFLLLFGVLVLGVTAGALCAIYFPLFQSQWVLPLQFSGIPISDKGFFYCFSSLLLNVLAGLIPLFLLGVTAFGVFAVPLFLFFRGMTVGIGVCYFLYTDELPGLLQSALIYTPAAAGFGVLLLLFAVRSLDFSRRLAKVSFSSPEESLDFRFYFHDFLLFLSWSVGVAFVGSLPAVVYGVFF